MYSGNISSKNKTNNILLSVKPTEGPNEINFFLKYKHQLRVMYDLSKQLYNRSFLSGEINRCDSRCVEIAPQPCLIALCTGYDY